MLLVWKTKLGDSSHQFDTLHAWKSYAEPTAEMPQSLKKRHGRAEAAHLLCSYKPWGGGRDAWPAGRCIR